MSNKAIRLARDISQHYLNDVPLIYDDAELTRYEAAFQIFKAREARLLTEINSQTAWFLNLFVQGIRVQILSRRETLVPEDDVKTYILSTIHLTQAWLKELVWWSSRLIEILE